MHLEAMCIDLGQRNCNSSVSGGSDDLETSNLCGLKESTPSSEYDKSSMSSFEGNEGNL